MIANAHAGDPYKIDTLFMYMANMAWNSSMNPGEAARMMADKDPQTGGYRIPHIIYADAFYSETVAYADLVLPDTTYLERWDCISLLDRPIGSPEGPANSIRQPVLPPDRDVRPFQDVLVELGARLKLPGFVKDDGSALYRDYADYIANHERRPGVGPLAGLRGADGTGGRRRRAKPRPVAALRRERLLLVVSPRARGALLQARQRRVSGGRQAAGPDRQHRADRAAALQRAAAEIPPRRRGPRPEPAARHASRADPHAISIRCRSGIRRSSSRCRSRPPIRCTRSPSGRSAMYHAWHSQNAWLRQIYSYNRLYMHRRTAAALGIEDDGWVWVISRNGRVKCQVRLMEGVNPDTVWTWNAIGKRRGAWNLSADAPESRARLPAEPRDLRVPAPDGGALQRRSGHRPGRVVRPARAGGKGRPPTPETAPRRAAPSAPQRLAPRAAASCRSTQRRRHA